MSQKVFIAVDLGATSGRTIATSIDNGKIIMNELTRFPNHIIEFLGHSYWDLPALYREIIGGLREAGQRGYDVVSIGIDTWGVDFANRNQASFNATRTSRSGLPIRQNHKRKRAGYYFY